MGRSIKKGPFVETHVLEKISKLNAAGGAKKPIRQECDVIVNP